VLTLRRRSSALAMEAAAQDARPGASERASAGRPGQFKATLKRDEEAARRRSALSQQQSEARSGRIADVRRIAMEALLGGDQQNDVEEEVEVEEECEEEEEGGGDAEMGDDRRRRNRRMTRLRRLHRTLFFARQLQVPDWMLAVPEDLAASWLMLVRPEGDRCLFLSDGGRVEVRRKNGYVLERFTDSRMPRGLTILDVVCIEGAPAAEPTAQADTSGSIVVDVDAAPPEEPEPQGECRLASAAAADVDMGGGGAGGRRAGRGAERGRGGRPKGDRTYAVCDVLIWGDSELASAEAECRMFWLSSRFSEISEKHPRRARPLQLIPAVPASPEEISKAYSSDVGYAKDSLMFIHRQGHYCVAEPVTPLALMWRDRQLSRFVVDTPDGRGEVLPERQALVLELRGGGRLRTGDHHIVAQLSEEDLARVQELTQGKGTKAKSLLRCEVRGVDIAAQKLEGVQPVAHVAARSRVWADSWGRIAFQHLHREGKAAQIAFDVLMRVASGGQAP